MIEMTFKENMMDRMMDKMSKEEKAEMMDKMMDKFFEDFTPEEKQQLMLKMMPKMMQGVDLSQMMPQMMMTMMGGMMGGAMGSAEGGAAPAQGSSIREALMGEASERDASSGSPAGKGANGRPGVTMMGGRMPMNMCEEMARALQSIADVNRELLNELKSR